MNTPLLKYTSGLLALSLVFTACKKSETFERKGVINEEVAYSCNGCSLGGLDITFTNDTQVYHISNDLARFGITPYSHFPVNVSVNTKPDKTAGNFVIITALKVLN